MAVKKQIDFDVVDSLCNIQCTGEEIASVLGVDYDTLNARIKEKYGILFSDYFELKRGAGKASLRRMQWKAAEAGNNTMLVWLGKQYLGQRDTPAEVVEKKLELEKEKFEHAKKQDAVKNF